MLKTKTQSLLCTYDSTWKLKIIVLPIQRFKSQVTVVLFQDLLKRILQ